MRFEIFTLFPGFFASPLDSSILKRGRESGALGFAIHDIRLWAQDKHHVCDDAPYGGGAGMVMKAEPLTRAVEDVLNYSVGPADEERLAPPCPVVLMSPQGRPFSQAIARDMSTHARVALLCGHYEGIDERAIEALATDSISVGDYVLTGGETAALVVMDAVSRFVCGVLGNVESAQGDSFSDGLLEWPCYTRPVEWRGRRVPDVLMSGHHGEVEKWRRRESLRRTLQQRPDLLEKCELSPHDLKTLSLLREENER